MIDAPIQVRSLQPDDFKGIVRLSKDTYPESWPWGRGQLTSQYENFPQGQFVAIDASVAPAPGPRIVGYASGLVIRAADHPLDSSWADTTEWGHLGTHDPSGDVFYGVEVMVHPDYQGQGVGKLLYRAREALVRQLGLRAIRAGARISGYRDYLAQRGLSDTRAQAEAYAARVAAGELRDPTLSFQLKQGFRVLAVVPGYFNDPPSLDYAALIEKTI